MKLLAKRIREGDQLAFDEFYRITYPKAMAYLNKVLYGKSAHDDVLQEAYIRLWLHREAIDVQQSVEAYFFTTLRHTVFNYLRKHAVERKRSLELDLEDDAQHPADNFIEHLHTKEFVARYHTVLQQISPVHQRCFRLHREHGLTYREIAQQEGIHIRTVERYISDTLQFLRENLMASHYLLCSMPSCLLMMFTT